MCCLVELGYCEDTDAEWLQGSTSASSQWTDPLGIYVRLCDRLLEPEALREGGGLMPEVLQRGEIMFQVLREGGSQHGSSPEADADQRSGGSAGNQQGHGARGLYGELQLDLSELVQLAGAVARAGMGDHPVMNAVSNALVGHLDGL